MLACVAQEPVRVPYPSLSSVLLEEDGGCYHESFHCHRFHSGTLRIGQEEGCDLPDELLPSFAGWHQKDISFPLHYLDIGAMNDTVALHQLKCPIENVAWGLV